MVPVTDDITKKLKSSPDTKYLKTINDINNHIEYILSKTLSNML